MENPASNFNFKVMAFVFKFRDILRPRKNILEESGIKPGFHVLDYGCGPGSYTAATSKLAGNSGKVHALDIHPPAIQMVLDIASRNKLTNVETILSDCNTGLHDDSVDVVLLYDVFHDLGDSNRVLEELHRVLKPDGFLSFTDHHMKEQEIVSRVTGSGLFKLSRKGKRTYSFSKEK